jgi:hypothetical protein
MAVTKFSSGGILLSLLAGCMLSPLAAQTSPEDSRPRLISPSEGEAIVLAAWELRRGLLPKPDCSHFVHAVYAQAGFDYEYSSSTAIFDGIDSFQRVKQPQAGDLVVWQGHMGIVVDPDEHSFYSSVLRGFAIESYRSNYWIGRGRARFYRLLVDDTRRAGPLVSSSLKQPLLRSSLQPDWTHENLHEDFAKLEAHESTPSDTEVSDAEGTDVEGKDVEVRNFAFVSQRRKPLKQEVLAAMIRSVDANSKRLRDSPIEALDSQPSVLVVDQFTVAALNIHDNDGWVKLRAKRMASIQYGKADLNESTDTWRVRLSRQERGWVVLMPQEPIYLRRQLAVPTLSNHLATMSRAPANNEERRKVVTLLDQLLSANHAEAGAGGSQ